MKFRRLLALTLIVVASVGLAELAGYFGVITQVRTLENRALDARQRTTPETFQDREGRERESDIVLVLFDEFSVMDSLDGWDWIQPAQRSHVARVVDALVLGGARTIGLDVFVDRLYPRLNSIDRGDPLLRESIQRAGNVILVNPVQVTDSGPVASPPHPYFAEVAADVGAAELPAAFETFREGTLAVRSGAGLEPSFALAMLAHARGFDVDSLLRQTRRWGRIPLSGLPIHVGQVPATWFERDAESESNIIPFRIRFVGPPSSSDAGDPPGTFQAYSSSSVIAMAEELPFLLPEYFQDKLVLIGTGWHNEDKFRTPFYAHEVPADSSATGKQHQYGWMYGVEIHANALQNMLDEEYVRPLTDRARLLLLFVVAFLAGGPAFWRGAGWGGAITVASLFGLLAYAWWAWAGFVYLVGETRLLTFDERFLWIPVITPTLAGVFSYVGSVAYVAVVEGKEKRFIKSAFGMYVSPEVVNEIAEHPEALQLGGQKRALSMLFSDLAGFTTLSERMDPQDLLAKLNEYLSVMTQIVLDEGGTLDKYIGDAIMAFWNAPKRVPDHADRALETAIFMQRKMDELNLRWSEADPAHEDLLVRIGINTGEVVVGNVGGKDRFDYSAIGDAVNLAARLEPANKSYGTLNMVSEMTLRAADASRYRVRELDFMAVKGKAQPVKVYELLELAGVALAPDKESALTEYERGLDRYRQHDWAGAKACFEAALAACPDDGPSRLYVRRCEDNLAEPPPPDWDFVVRRDVK